MSLEMAHKVILPPKKNYIPQFLKQRDINSYSIQSCLNMQDEFKTGIFKCVGCYLTWIPKTRIKNLHLHIF
jgi:hypothetical protein